MGKETKIVENSSSRLIRNKIDIGDYNSYD